MKRIIAFVKPIMLDEIISALHDIENFPGASISDVLGIGSGSREHLEHSGRTPLHGFPKSTRIEIVCLEEQVQTIVESLLQKGHTGLPDDGKIFVSNVEEAVRIRTGEWGATAV